jgi:hypothetical protein
MNMLSMDRYSAIIIAVAFACTGCSTEPRTDYSKVDLVSVSGTITLDGEPLAEAVVTFNDTSDGTFSYGLTDTSGRYVLQFDSVKQGCKPGTKRVEISTKRKILGLNTSEEGGDDSDAPAVELVPAKYNKDSELTVEVNSSSTTHNFELSSN